MKSAAIVLCYALVGGLVGHVGFQWLLGQGFYGLILPGGMLGLAAGMPRNRSLGVAVTCGVLALLLGLLTEWRFRPFVRDASLGYFLTHLHALTPVTLLMIAGGTGLGFWIPFRRISDEPVQDRRHPGE